MAPDDPTPACGRLNLLGHGLAGREALLAGLRTLLAAGHVTALQTLGGTVLARLGTQPTHRARQRRLVLHQSNARPARLQARQAVLLAVGAITSDEAFPTSTQALVARFDAILFERRIKCGLGSRRRKHKYGHHQDQSSERNKDRFHGSKDSIGYGDQNSRSRAATR